MVSGSDVRQVGNEPAAGIAAEKYEGGLEMRRVMIMLMLVIAVAAFGSYNKGIQAYNSGDKDTAEKLLAAYVDGGGRNSMAYIILGEIAKGRKEHDTAANYYEAAGKVGKGKNRCTGYRCLIYSLTKKWTEKGIPRGDAAMKVLEKEYKDNGDAKVAIGYWANRRGYELMKAKKLVAATGWFEKAVKNRPDFPLFANNLAVCLCERAEKAEGQAAKDLARRAADALRRWEDKRDPKLDATRERAVKLMNK